MRDAERMAGSGATRINALSEGEDSTYAWKAAARALDQDRLLP